jgi:hypothetical protein
VTPQHVSFINAYCSAKDQPPAHSSLERSERADASYKKPFLELSYPLIQAYCPGPVTAQTVCLAFSTPLFSSPDSLLFSSDVAQKHSSSPFTAIFALSTLHTSPLLCKNPLFAGVAHQITPLKIPPPVFAKAV